MTCDARSSISGVPEPDYSDPKELYAFLGMVVYRIQLLERGLLNLLVGLKLSKKAIPKSDDVERLFSTGDRKTLGQVLGAVRELVPFDPVFDSQISEALSRRNYLIHRFFPEHDIDILSDDGRAKMIDELYKSISFFKELDSEIDRLVYLIWEKYGFTEQVVEEELENLKKALEMS